MHRRGSSRSETIIAAVVASGTGATTPAAIGMLAAATPHHARTVPAQPLAESWDRVDRPPLWATEPAPTIDTDLVGQGCVSALWGGSPRPAPPSQPEPRTTNKAAWVASRS